jgi:hypothetical protein
MSIVNGQAANATTFNNGFVSKTANSTMAGILTLSNSSSASVADVQGSINDVDSRVTALEGAESVATHIADTTPHATVSGASIEAPTRLDVKQDTKANLDTYATTASNGQLCFATDEKLMYQVVDGFLTEFGGGGGVGTLETVYAESFESTDPTDWVIDNNNDATFLETAGTPGGAISAETTTPINGNFSLKYTGSATAADNTDDWIAEPTNIATTLKMRGNTCGINLWYTWSGTNDYFKVVVWDVTNSALLSESNWYLKNTSVPALFSSSFFVPTSCNNIRAGVQCITGEVSKVLVIDDITISTDPFNFKNLLDTQYVQYNTHAGYGSTNTKIPYFTNLVTSTGSGFFTVENSATNGFSITVQKKCIVSMSYSRDGEISGISLNSTQLTTSVASINIANRVMLAINSTIYTSNPNATLTLNVGDVLRPHITGGGSGSAAYSHITVSAIAESEHVITPAKSGIEEIYIDGFTSRSGNDILFKTVQKNTLSKLATVTTSTSTKLAALKKSVAFMSASGTVNSVSVVMFVYNSAGTQIAEFRQTNGSNIGILTSGIYVLSPGDYILIKSTANLTDDTTAHFNAILVDFEQQMLSALPKIEPCYIKDVKAANNNGGTFSSGSWVKRTLNVINTTGSTTTGSCSWASIASDQITLQPGSYKFSAKLPAADVNYHIGLLYNVTTAADQLLGSSAYTNDSNVATTVSEISGSITLTTPQVFELRHRCATTSTGTNGLGQAVNLDSKSETYTQVEITRLW